MSEAGLPQARGELHIDATQALASIARLKTELGSLGKTAAGLKTAFPAGGGSFEPAVEGLARGAEKAEQKLQSLQGNLGTVADGLAKLAVPAIAAGAAAGVMAGRFDTAMRNINSIAGLTEDGLGQLGQSFLDLSNDSSKTRESAVSLAEGFYEIQSSGFAGADGMKVLEASTLAASAGMTSTAVSSRAIAGALNAYGDGAQKAAEYSDVLFQTVNLGVVNFEELSGSIGRVLPNASALNVNIQNVGAAISTLTKAGVSGSQAVTNLNSLFSSIIKPTKEASEAAEEYGFDLSAAALQSKGLTRFLQEMYEATDGNVAAMGKLIGSQEGMNAALILASGGAKNFAADLAQMEDAAGKTQDAYEEMGQSVQASLQELRKSFENAAVVAGTALTPAIQSTGAAVNDMVAAFNRLPADEQQKYIQIATAVAGLVVGLFALTKAVQGTMAAFTTMRAATVLFTSAASGASGAASALGVSLAGLAAPLAVAGGLIALATTIEGDLQAQTDKTAAAIARRSQVLQDAIALQQELAGRTGTGEDEVRQEERLQQALENHARIRERIGRLQADNAFFGLDPLGIRTRDLQAANVELEYAENGIRQLIAAVEDENRVKQEAQAFADYRAGELESARAVTEAVREQADAVSLTQEEWDKYNEAVSANAEAGRAAVNETVAVQLEGLARLAEARASYEAELKGLQDERAAATTDTERAAIDERIAALQAGYAQEEAVQAESYARQLAAATAHVGALLQEYVAGQAAVGKISSEQAAELQQAIADEFGVIPDIIGSSYDEMVNRINQGGSTDQIVADLSTARQEAVDTKQRFDELFTERVGKLKLEYDAGSLTPEQYAEALRKVPAEVTTQVHAETAAAEEAIARTQQNIDEIATRAATPIKFAVDTSEAQTAVQNTQAEIDALATQNDKKITVDADTSAAETSLQDTKTAVENIPTERAITLTDNAGETEIRIDAVTGAVEGVPDGATITFKDNAGATTDRVNDVKTAVLTLPDGKQITLTTNAASVALQLRNVAGAVNSIPATKTVTIRADINEQLVRRSPAPIEQVLDALEKHSKQAKRITVAAEGLSDIDAIVSALDKLKAYETGQLLDLTISGFAGDAERVLREMIGLAARFDADAVKAGGEFSQNASSLVSLVGAGADALNKLAEREGTIDRAAIGEFKLDIEAIVRELVLMAAVFDAEGMTAAADFADSAGKLLGLVSEGVDAVTALVDYRPKQITQAQLLDFSSNLERILVVLGDLAQRFEQEGTEKGATFAEAARKTVGLIAEGIKAVDTLVTYKTGRSYDAQLTGLAYDLRRVIFVLDDLAREFEIEGVEAGAAFATAAGKTIGLIADAVEAFAALDESKPLDLQAFDILAANIELAVAEMVEMAGRIDSELLPQTVAFAEAAEKVLRPIATAVDTFTKVNDYAGVSPDAFKLLASDMVGVVGHMVALTQTLKREGYPAAVEFSETAGSVFGGLSAGLDFLIKVGDYEPGKAVAAFGGFQTDFLTVLGMAEGMATQAGAFLEAAETWEDKLGRGADALRGGVDSLVGLDGLGVTLVASISASAAAPAAPTPSGPGEADTAALGRRVAPQASATASRAAAWGADGAAAGGGDLHMHFHGDMHIRDDKDIPKLARHLEDHWKFSRPGGS